MFFRFFCVIGQYLVFFYDPEKPSAQRIVFAEMVAAKKYWKKGIDK